MEQIIHKSYNKILNVLLKNNTELKYHLKNFISGLEPFYVDVIRKKDNLHLDDSLHRCIIGTELGFYDLCFDECALSMCIDSIDRSLNTTPSIKDIRNFFKDKNNDKLDMLASSFALITVDGEDFYFYITKKDDKNYLVSNSNAHPGKFYITEIKDLKLLQSDEETTVGQN